MNSRFGEEKTRYWWDGPEKVAAMRYFNPFLRAMLLLHKIEGGEGHIKEQENLPPSWNH